MTSGSLRIDSMAKKYFAVINLKDGQGKRKQKVVNLRLEAISGNKRKANTLLRDVLAEYDAKQGTVNSDVTFCDCIKLWLENEAKKNLALNTYEAYKQTYEAHIEQFECGSRSCQIHNL